MSINSNNYADIRPSVDEPPIIFTADYWRVQVSKAVMQLVREVHALNPGIVFEADLRPIAQVASAHARMEVPFP